MAKCVPGMPCYGANVIVYTTYPNGCLTTVPSPFTLPLSSDSIYYAGPNLPYTGIQTEDTLTEAIQKIDVQLNPEVIFELFVSAIDNNPTLKAIFCAKIAECP
jgi:hypothetical protein